VDWYTLCFTWFGKGTFFFSLFIWRAYRDLHIFISRLFGLLLFGQFRRRETTVSLKMRLSILSQYCWKSEVEFLFMAICELCTYFVWLAWLVETPTPLYGCHVICFFPFDGGVFFRFLWFVTDFQWFITFNPPYAEWITLFFSNIFHFHLLNPKKVIW